MSSHPARLFAILLAVAAVQALVTVKVGAATLRPAATVDGDQVTLGDLFDDAGPEAASVVATAPEPGRRMIFDSHSLAALASTHGLDWRPASPHDRAVVERSAVIIGADRIESLVSDAVAEKGAARPFALVFDEPPAARALPRGTGELTIETLSWDPDRQRFSGTLTAAAPDGPVHIAVSGRTAPVVEIPVPNRAIDPGAFVGVGDLDLVPMQADRVARDAIRSVDDIVGRPAARLIQPGRPLRSNDLVRNLVVRRGETVTLVLDDPSMSLSATGRALTDGAKGESVKVLNLASSRVVEGVAAAANLVTVSVPDAPVPDVRTGAGSIQNP